MSDSSQTPVGRIRPAAPTLMGEQVIGLAQQCRPPTDDTMLVPAPPAGLAESATTPVVPVVLSELEAEGSLRFGFGEEPVSIRRGAPPWAFVLAALVVLVVLVATLVDTIPATRPAEWATTTTAATTTTPAINPPAEMVPVTHAIAPTAATPATQAETKADKKTKKTKKAKKAKKAGSITIPPF